MDNRTKLFLDRLNRVAYDLNDPTLKAFVDLYRQRPDNYQSFEDFLVQTIESLVCAHQLTRDAYAEHIKLSPPVVYITGEWRDMNS